MQAMALPGKKQPTKSLMSKGIRTPAKALRYGGPKVQFLLSAPLLYFVLWGHCTKGLVIIYGEVGERGWDNKTGKSRVRNFLRPPPSRQGKTFRAPLLKSGHFLCPPPSNMAKTSSYSVKTTPTLFVSHLQHG